jgi:hypothetical protein
MTGTTPIHDARERVAAERSSVAEKADELATFRSRLDSISPTQVTQESATQTVSGPMTATSGTDRRSTVRSAFAETVAPHTDGDSTLAAIRTELGDGVALALAPTTQTAFTPELRSQVFAATQSRRRELDVTTQALDREADQVEAALEPVEGLLAWLQTTDRTPLSELAFEALRARHDRLTEWDSRLETVGERRQAFLHGTTSDSGRVGVDNHDLVLSVYDDFAVDHPVLATVTELQGVLADCRTVVRDHLVRRV